MDDQVRIIRQGARIVQATTGFTLGLYLFVYGMFFYEKFGGAANPNALSWMTLTFVACSIVKLVFDIPTGAIADHFGRRKTIIASFLFQSVYFLSLAAMWFIHTPSIAFTVAVIGYSIFGVGYVLLSGALVAWVVDSIRIHKLPEGHGPILVDSYRYYFVAQLVGTIISLLLFSSGLIFYAFSLGFIACLVCSLYCVLVMEETRGMNFSQEKFIFGASMRAGLAKIGAGFRILADDRTVLLLSLTNACFMFMVFVVTFLWPVVMQSQFGIGKLSVWWYAISVSTIIVSYAGTRTLQNRLQRFKLAGKAVHNLTLLRWIVFGCLAAAIPVCLFATGAQSGTSVGFSLLVWGVIATYGGYGFLRPCYETLVNNYLTAASAHERATALSIGSSFASALTIFFMTPSGKGADTAAPSGWLIPAGLLMFTACLTGFVVWRRERNTRVTEPAAEIIHPTPSTALHTQEVP